MVSKNVSAPTATPSTLGTPARSETGIQRTAAEKLAAAKAKVLVLTSPQVALMHEGTVSDVNAVSDDANVLSPKEFGLDAMSGKIKSLPVLKLRTLGRANPRLDFSNLEPLMNDIVSNANPDDPTSTGQKNAILVHRLSGPALEYVNEKNLGEPGFPATAETDFVIEGARRHAAFAKLDEQFSAQGDNRYREIGCIVGGTVSSVSVLIGLILDNIGRAALGTRIEVARSFKMLRDNGWTLAKIAKTHNISIGKVTTHLDVFRLPNDDVDGFMQDEVERFDLLRARGGDEWKKYDGIVWSDKVVSALATSYQASRNPNFKPHGNQTEAIPAFDDLAPAIRADKGASLNSPDGDKSPIKRDEIAKVREIVQTRFAGSVKAAALAALDALTLPGGVDALKVHFAAKPGTEMSAPVNVNAPVTSPVPVPAGASEPRKGRKGRK